MALVSPDKNHPVRNSGRTERILVSGGIGNVFDPADTIAVRRARVQGIEVPKPVVDVRCHVQAPCLDDVNVIPGCAGPQISCVVMGSPVTCVESVCGPWTGWESPTDAGRARGSIAGINRPSPPI